MNIIIILVLVIVYILSVFGAMKLVTMEKEKIKKEDGPFVLTLYLPVFNTMLAVVCVVIAFIEWNRKLLNNDIDSKIKEDFKKKVDEQHPNTTLQPPQYDRMTQIELELSKKFNIPNEAWLLIYEWEKLKYEEGVYVGNVFPKEAKMNNPMQCKNFFESIKDTTEKLTSGNVAHHKNEIIRLAQRGIENITEK